MKRLYFSRGVTLLTAAIALSAVGGNCGGSLVQDPTFRDWCGSSLCSWHLDSGHIQRVPTWNENDFGVSFVDQGTQISQITQDSSSTCLLFTSVGDIDPEAQLVITVDFDNDGTIDFTAPLGTANWHQVQAQITTPVLWR